MNYKPRLIARVPTQNPSNLEDPVILTMHYENVDCTKLLYHFGQFVGNA